MNKYEYMTAVLGSGDIESPDDRLVAKLNRLGENGWELVSAITQPCFGSSQYNLLGISRKNILIFKRCRARSGEDS